MPSDLQITNIRDQANATSAITIGSDGQITVNQNNPTVTLGSNTTFPTGHVLQVLQSVKSDADSVAGSTAQNNFSFVPAQGGASGSAFQQEITVTGSNKVLVLHVGNYSLTGADYQFYIGLFRGSASDTAIGSCTKIGAGTEPSTNQTSASNNLLIPHISQALPLTTSFLDSPGAGTHFYKIGWGGETGGNFLINRTGTNTDNGNFASLSSSLTLMEVQA